MSYEIDFLIGKVTGGCIIGLDGGIWASTPGFYGSTAEFSHFKDAFDPQSEMIFKGIVFLGETYVVTDINPEYVVAKKGANSLVIVKRPTCIVLGYNDDQIKFETCFNAVTKLAQSLPELK
ncbi:hypothetical protein TVAG_166350 [Trichomonas vaginalis G3]|uniref:Profilin n=1 Tax=Trichomonas vaginalis (strain ATCC PRA-98 / G3) TaxID=412133 RepID=A2DE42_TRIV3|nr:profilin (actin-binding protein) family [Trichomonas vaginalis G3]EAY21260.1 hypothetical protein TVAG_166350 [Trichomonas vaginalis G3]KAI5548834.1 profilin (actin-binding protein) family [Trichomonas vaginalis G3]|eukprot:XP_001582246.1 hypothetical protein [Trichomonas vaginalis G3]